MTWLPEWTDAARAIVDQVLAEPVPDVENAGPTPGGHYYRLVGDGNMATFPDVEGARDFLVDVRWRVRVRELSEGQPPEVRDLAWELLPYRSTIHRFGWDAEKAVRAGRITRAQVEEIEWRRLLREIA